MKYFILYHIYFSKGALILHEHTTICQNAPTLLINLINFTLYYIGIHSINSNVPLDMKILSYLIYLSYLVYEIILYIMIYLSYLVYEIILYIMCLLK